MTTRDIYIYIYHVYIDIYLNTRRVDACKCIGRELTSVKERRSEEDDRQSALLAAVYIQLNYHVKQSKLTDTEVDRLGTDRLKIGREIKDR